MQNFTALSRQRRARFIYALDLTLFAGDVDLRCYQSLTQI